MGQAIAAAGIGSLAVLGAALALIVRSRRGPRALVPVRVEEQRRRDER